MGFEASKHIHGVNPDIPIIMLTAYQDEHDISRVVDLGFEGYVTKGAIEITPEGEVVFPNLNDLKNKLKRACEKYRGVFRNKHFEHATDPRLIEDIVEFSMDIESPRKGSRRPCHCRTGRGDTVCDGHQLSGKF